MSDSDADWNAMVEAMTQHVADHGRLPSKASPLGQWLAEQRAEQSSGSLPGARGDVLREQSWWRGAGWRHQHWLSQLDVVVTHYAETALLPSGDAGAWVTAQVSAYRAGKLRAERVAMLEKQPWWAARVRGQHGYAPSAVPKATVPKTHGPDAPTQPVLSGERRVLDLGEYGRVTVHVDVDWLGLPDETLHRLRSALRALDEVTNP